MIGTTATYPLWNCPVDCGCSTGECRARRSAESRADTTWKDGPWFSTESDAWTESRKAADALAEELRAWAFVVADRRKKTRRGWTWEHRTAAPSSSRETRARDYQRRPGRPSRHRGRGGPRPLRGTKREGGGEVRAFAAMDEPIATAGA